MASLPLELWTLIIGCVARTDLKSCRLTNRHLCHLVSIQLFSQLYVSSNHESLRRARTISKSPSFSRFVKTLVYRIDELKEQTFPLQPERLEHFHQCFQPDNPYFAFESSYMIRSEFPRSAESLTLGDQSTEGRELRYLLSRFPNLTSTEIRCRDEIRSGDKKATPDIDFSNHLIEKGFDAAILTGRLLLVLLVLAKAPHIATKSLTCERLSWNIFDRVASIRMPVYTVLDALRHLHLEFIQSSFYLYRDSVDSIETVARFFKATSRLEVLILDFGAEDQYALVDEAAQLGNTILSSTIWPNLKTLSLAGFMFGEHELLEFLRVHPTLRSLRLCSICLQNGSAVSLIHGLHECSRLDNFSFHGIYDDRVLEDSSAVWEGICLGSRNVIHESDDITLPSSGLTSDKNSELECAGYRSEEWFGGNSSWCACDGTLLNGPIASMFCL